MKFCKIQDTLNRCSSFLDVACIALDNEHFFPEGNTVSLLLEDVIFYANFSYYHLPVLFINLLVIQRVPTISKNNTTDKADA